MNKILVIVGPTATGKTALAIDLAQKFNGEIISADSQQVYKGNDVETGKDLDKSKIKIQKSKLQFKNKNISTNYYQLGDISIWGVDLVAPGKSFNVSDFCDFAQKVINDIVSRKRLPIIVGGSSLYIRALVEPLDGINVPPNFELRSKNYELWKLQEKLQKLDQNKWLSLNESDQKNPRRLIRAIEIAKSVPKLKRKKKKYDALIIGLTAPREILRQKVAARRKSRPDLIAREQTLAKKQLLYQKKYLSAVWFDITDPKVNNTIECKVEEFLQPTISKSENMPTTWPKAKK